MKLPKNNSKARKDWRRARVQMKTWTPQERLLHAIFGDFKGSNDLRPGGRVDGLLQDQVETDHIWTAQGQH